MEFTTTKKGNRKLIHEGYMSFKKPGEWCNIMGMRKKRRGGECTAKIKLDEAGNFLQRINNQTHAPSKTKSGKAKVRENIKRRATETQDPAQVILGI